MQRFSGEFLMNAVRDQRAFLKSNNQPNEGHTLEEQVGANDCWVSFKQYFIFLS